MEKFKIGESYFYENKDNFAIYNEGEFSIVFVVIDKDITTTVEIIEVMGTPSKSWVKLGIDYFGRNCLIERDCVPLKYRRIKDEVSSLLK